MLRRNLPKKVQLLLRGCRDFCLLIPWVFALGMEIRSNNGI
jgi:hypothetical protein